MVRDEAQLVVHPRALGDGRLEHIDGPNSHSRSVHLGDDAQLYRIGQAAPREHDLTALGDRARVAAAVHAAVDGEEDHELRDVRRWDVLRGRGAAAARREEHADRGLVAAVTDGVVEPVGVQIPHRHPGRLPSRFEARGRPERAIAASQENPQMFVEAADHGGQVPEPVPVEVSGCSMLGI